MALFSIPFIDILHTGNYTRQNYHLRRSNNNTNSSSNGQTQKDELPQDTVNAKMQQDHELSCNSNEQVQLGEKSADTCTSTLTLIRVILCVVVLYECYFDLIDHLPIEAFSVRVVLAVIFRVQSSLIIFQCMYSQKKLFLL